MSENQVQEPEPQEPPMLEPSMPDELVQVVRMIEDGSLKKVDVLEKVNAAVEPEPVMGGRRRKRSKKRRGKRSKMTRR